MRAVAVRDASRASTGLIGRDSSSAPLAYGPRTRAVLAEEATQLAVEKLWLLGEGDRRYFVPLADIGHAEARSRAHCSNSVDRPSMSPTKVARMSIGRNWVSVSPASRRIASTTWARAGKTMRS